MRMYKKVMSLAGSALLAAAVLTPIQAIGEPICVENQCEAVFSYTGATQTFTIPQGVTQIEFEVLGAAGGRGGQGGKVTGTLTNLPSELVLVVGGVGGVGSGAAGGYNGGGNAGGNRGNEGAGGGASDIRLNQELTSRIVVAGGGGGAGGYSGAAGGAGGLELAANGGSGQGSGGGGGTQESGGFAGASNGGSASSGGSFGRGGTGGSSWNAGGGGGGGGWYGGGGGGGDDDDCCSDGGGGGGGSSYADQTYVSNIIHTAGVGPGHGTIILRYAILPVLVSFTANQTSSSSASVQFQMSQDIVDLALGEISVADQVCQVSSLMVEGGLAMVELTDCMSGEIALTLAAASIGTGSQGPAVDQVMNFQLDLLPPSFSFQEDSITTSNSNLVIGFQSDAGALSSLSFQVIGCQEFSVEQSAISLSGCIDGEHSITLSAHALVDEFGNSAPSTDLGFSFWVDTQGPLMSWQLLEVLGAGPFTYSAILSFSEPASFSPEMVTFTSSSQCQAQSSQGEVGWLFEAGCGYGFGTWSLSPALVSDQLGNYSIGEDLLVSFLNLEPAPVVEVAPEVYNPPPVYSPPPAQPQPDPVVVVVEPEVFQDPVIVSETKSSEVTQSASVSISVTQSPELQDLIQVILEEPEKEPIPARITQNSQVTSNGGESEAAIEELIVEEQIAVEETSNAEPIQTDKAVIVPVAGEPIELRQQSSFPWLPVALAGFVMLLGFGIWRFSGK